MNSSLNLVRIVELMVRLKYFVDRRREDELEIHEQSGDACDWLEEESGEAKATEAFLLDPRKLLSALPPIPPNNLRSWFPPRAPPYPLHRKSRPPADNISTNELGIVLYVHGQRIQPASTDLGYDK